MTQRPTSLWPGLASGSATAILVCAGPILERLPVPGMTRSAVPSEGSGALIARLMLLLATVALAAWLSRPLIMGSRRPGSQWALLLLLPGLAAASVHGIRLFSSLPLGLAPASLAALACGLLMGRSAALLGAAATLAFLGISQAAQPEVLLALGAGALTQGLIAQPRQVSLLVPAALAGAVVQGGLLALSPPPTLAGAGFPSLSTVGLWAAGPLVAAVFVLLFLWPLFRMTGVSSAWRLRRTASPHHPLLRELRRRAPGTFRHSANVAVLAEAGGRAIGADLRLLRATALHHDVGKLAAPGYFMENASDGPDPHEALSPEKSAWRLRQHVRDGLLLARRFRLPAEILPGIAEHHGTAILRRPAERARAEGLDLDPAVYHYPGPLPRSRESAILMVADAVEGASRQLDDPSLAAVSALVEQVVDRLMREYQFEDCPLGQVDLISLQSAMVGALRHGLHRRRVDPDAMADGRSDLAPPAASPATGDRAEETP